MFDGMADAAEAAGDAQRGVQLRLMALLERQTKD
jgi:hypothetical protein